MERENAEVDEEKDEDGATKSHSDRPWFCSRSDSGKRGVWPEKPSRESVEISRSQSHTLSPSIGASDPDDSDVVGVSGDAQLKSQSSSPRNRRWPKSPTLTVLLLILLRSFNLSIPVPAVDLMLSTVFENPA